MFLFWYVGYYMVLYAWKTEEEEEKIRLRNATLMMVYVYVHSDTNNKYGLRAKWKS